MFWPQALLLLALALATKSSSSSSSSSSYSSSSRTCLVYGSGISRINGMFANHDGNHDDEDAEISFHSENARGVFLERHKVEKGSYYWLIRRKDLVLYTSPIDQISTSPPQGGWEAKDGVKTPPPRVECQTRKQPLSPALAAPAMGERAKALCPPKGAKSLCAFAILGPRNATLKTIMPSSGKRVDGVALRDWHIEHVLNRTMEKEAAKFNKINFQWLELPCQSAFTDAFGGIDADKVPTMILLNPKRRRYTIFTGVYNVGPLMEWISGVIYGKIRTSELKGDVPVLGDLDCEAENRAAEAAKAKSQGGGGGDDDGDGDGNSTENDDADSDGMMAEIRKEEEEGKKQREREIVAEAKAEEQAKKDAALAAEAAEAEKKKAADAKKKRKKKKKRRKKKKKKNSAKDEL